MKAMKLNPLLTLALTILILIGATTATLLYAEGWRFNAKTKTIQKTGMLAIRSVPEAAKVYLNSKITTATNDTIQSLTPGTYDVKVEKGGFEPWEKQIEIYPELVTDITAILVSQSPRIEPLTNTGVSAFAMSGSLDKIAYTTKGAEKPGIWILPLSGGTLNLFKTNPNLVAEDTKDKTYSSAENIWWAPDDSELLIQMNQQGYYLFDLQNQGKEPQELTDPSTVLDRWQKDLSKRRTALLEKQNISEELKAIALLPSTLWSPDDKKFMYLKNYGDVVEINVHNMENPLPVGEKKDYVTYRLNKDSLKSVAWYPDSYNFFILENQNLELMRVDGSNKTEIFSANGNLASNQICSSPWGDKVIILASFKQNALPDLYAVGIR